MQTSTLSASASKLAPVKRCESLEPKVLRLLKTSRMQPRLLRRLRKVATDSRLTRVGVAGYNKPKRTPSHPTKSHVVVAKEGDQVKTIRFGQQGVTGSPEGSARNEAFKARHAKNIAKGKMSAAYWANKVKW